ncbi:MAG: DDE-type integrase/transposase/recombinase [Chloroflexi bacterium]|nr:DDE-type integrase/transposase/recombinase [Chloroflexota bacterium]
MGRLRFNIGTRYLLRGQWYLVRDVLVQGQLRVSNQTLGGDVVVAQSELYEAWGQGDLVFEVAGNNTRKGQDSPYPTEYTVADFALLAEGQRAEAWRRYEIIRPLLERPAGKRTRGTIADHIATLLATATKQGKPVAVSATSVYRWLRAFRQSGYDIRALVPASDQRGGKGRPRLAPDVERLLEGVLAECAASPNQRSGTDVYWQVVNRVADENRTRPPDMQLEPPSYGTVYGRIRHRGAESILRRRASRTERQADAMVLPGPRTTRVLQRVEIDHTPLDLIVVDETQRLPIGRPYLTLAVDVFSGMPFGFYIGWEPSSYYTVMEALLHGILPKPDCPAIYHTKNPWPVYGLPEMLVVDNGKDFVGRDLADACAQLGIVLEYMAVRSPWLKGAIERFFRSIAQGLVHPLPGSTLSNVLQLGDYDPAKDACITLGAFTELLHIFLLDEYAQRWHKGKKGIPARLWHESVQSGFAPALHHSSTELRILMGRIEERTIQRTGINFENLRYQSPDLFRLRARLPKGAKVKFKYDPKDIGTLHVLDTTEPGGAQWLPVPAIDQEYAAGLPLKTHRLLHELFVRQRSQGQADVWERAEVKRHVRELVAREFSLTRKLGKRKRLARHLLGMGDQGQPQVAGILPPLPGSPPTLPAPIQGATTATTERTPADGGRAPKPKGKATAAPAQQQRPLDAVDHAAAAEVQTQSYEDGAVSAEQPFGIDDLEYESDANAWGSSYDLPAPRPRTQPQDTPGANGLTSPRSRK